MGCKIESVDRAGSELVIQTREVSNFLFHVLHVKNSYSLGDSYSLGENSLVFSDEEIWR